MNRFFLVVMITMMAMLSSCSDTDYVNSIPKNASAIVSIDMGQVTGVKSQALLKALLHATNVSDCGIDLSSTTYFFETIDGNLGLCVRVADSDDLAETMKGLASKGVGGEIKERRGFRFTMLNNAWVAGFSDHSLLVMGPVALSARAEMESRMATLLSQDEEHGVKSSPLFERLDSISAPISMVAQAKALPEKMIAPFTLGAPKDADPSQVLFAAELSVSDNCLEILGNTFSFNKRVDQSLRQSSKVFRPIKGKYASMMAADAQMGMFMNVKGTEYIDLLRQNNAFQAMLAGINTAIDMDNIIKSVDGDLAIIVPVFSEERTSMSMTAELAHTKWLADVDYWKKSCPSGGRITDWERNAFSYINGSTSFFFGVTDDGQFFSGSNASDAKKSLLPAENPLSKPLQEKIVGSRMAMVLNMSAFTGERSEFSTLQNLLRPIIGGVNTIVYRMK